jgi:asparagine synthase (glutamine-hydrolysing)
MLDSLCTESFYNTGTWIDESLGIYAGWSVHKGAFADELPLTNEQGDVVLLFSGEDFPEPGSVSRPCDNGHALNAGASYIVHQYEDDSDFPARLNGIFHGLIADRRRGIATLFNDRYGMHKLYYHQARDTFYFAVEAKAILSIRPDLRTLDIRALGELLSFGSVVGDRTLFKGIHVLPGGSAWTFDNGTLRATTPYFRPRDWETQPPMETEAYYATLRDTFARILPRYFETRSSIGMSLTGGLDTRMIMAWRKPLPDTLPCYTFGGTYRDCRDVLVARQVAQLCKQSHRVITLGNDFLANFANYAQRTVYVTDGCADVGRSPALYVNQKARDISPVRMAGIYGSEILRRVRSFKPAEPAAGLFSPELLSSIHAAKDTYLELRRQHPVSFAVFHSAPQRGVDRLESSQLTVRFPYLDNDLVRLAFRAPEAAIVSSDTFADHDLCLRLIADGDGALRRLWTDRGIAGPQGALSTAFRAVQEITFKAEYAYDYGMPHWFTRIDRALSAFHPERLFLGRHKFYHFRIWYRDTLSTYVKEMLLDPRTLSRPYIESKRLQSIVHAHITGTANYTLEIHKLLTLELIQRLFVDSR